MPSYEPKNIESKWQEVWEKEKIYQAKDFDQKPKFYTLIEFPYPSGAGLHVGHARSWSAMDAYSRKKRMQGYNVIFPIGWDAFGLPTENYAIKNKIHPSIATSKNIATFKKQIKKLGISFDWNREINTTDPKYYKWTQWIFLKLLENKLAFQKEVLVNWCPSCKTTLANEEVLANGAHERCGQLTEKRLQKQWLLRITKYAQRLLDDLNLVDYSPKIRIQQENWIGKKEGINITYDIDGISDKVIVFTTAPVNFGATFIVVAPEHELVKKIVDGKIDVLESNVREIKQYLEISKRKTEQERLDEKRKKTGVFTGLYAINHVTNGKIPIWVTDFVIASVGTGAVQGCPGHDIRDFQFAKEFNIPIVRVIKGEDSDESQIEKEDQVIEHGQKGCFINSGFLNGLEFDDGLQKTMDYFEKKGWGRRVVSYHLRDWIFSRQHYWGEPIPIIHCEKCGVIPVPEKDLPVELPYVEKYEPSGTGESPLASIKEWVSVKCPKCGESARRETDTMPNWAGSNWYFVRYLDPNNEKELSSLKKMKYWLPIDIYQGGFEHTTLHLLYSRFIYKFLYDIGVVPTPEPYAKRRSHGIVLGPDNRKMSKSFGNVVNPDEIVLKYGADTLRLYEMFMGPFDQAVSWNEDSLQGCFRFLTRTWRLFNENIKEAKTSDNLSRKLHQTIKKVAQDFEELKFNTIVSALMEFINDWGKSYLSKKDAESFIKILAPLAPHISEEIWTGVLKNEFSVHKETWPEYDKKLIIEDLITIMVQVNGKVRAQVEMKNEDGQVEAKAQDRAKKDPRIIKYLEGKEIKKTIFVPGKLVNFVIN
ncbi:MAG: leucine--tRNA ligase [Parcubacteria group bacterium CG10_big_fil_rev_8_21_14_0_10_35_15]|nr:MAG: leucine--tRNA ligase [Parcubacteria group bacterium CG10_big_fil_rev_8_21_14_0_10_35_15]